MIRKTLRIKSCSAVCSRNQDQQPRFNSSLAQISLKKYCSEDLTKNRGQPRLREALHQLEQNGNHPATATYASLLRACGNSKSLEEGRRVHSRIIQSRPARDIFIENHLMQMYGNCIALEDARSVFNTMDAARNVFSWTIIIGAYAQHGQCAQALRLYRQMQEEGVKPDNITFINALGACSGSANLVQGKEIHESVVEGGFLSDAVVRNALLNMYGKCGSLESAWELFNKMNRQHVVSWNSMIAACTQHGEFTDCMLLYRQMLAEGVKPDKVTFISTVNACSSLIALALGKQIHCAIIGLGFESDVVLGTALINMYDKCERILDASIVFGKMHERDVVSWNSMIAAYVQHGHNEDAYELYHKMRDEGVKPNEATFTNVLGACTSLTALAHGKDIHASIEKCGLESNVIVGTALVHLYGECGQLEDASRVFHKLHGRNVISWTAIIAAYSQHGQGKEALHLYRQMLAEGVEPNTVTFVSVLGACSSLLALTEGKEIHANIIDCRLESDVLVGTALVNMYGKFSEVEVAKRVFEKLSVRDVVSWTSMIAAYAQHGNAKESLLSYQQMQDEGVKPDKYCFINVLFACSRLAALPQGKEIHATIVDSGLELDGKVGTALINMYGKCGTLEDARGVLQNINEQNFISWSALIAAYAHAGYGKKTLHLFQQMLSEKVEPDGITFLSVLYACSHAGLVDEGWGYFGSMNENHGITPTLEHCACMVDLIGRAGRLEEAENFIFHMPLEPDVVIWRTFLGACRVHGDVDRGRKAAEYIVQLDPQITAPYVLLSNIYAADVRQDVVVQSTNALMESCEKAAWGQLKERKKNSAWIYSIK